MKMNITLFIALAFCRSLLAGDALSPSRASTLLQEGKPAACCAVESAPKPAACCPVESVKKDACPVRHRLGEGGCEEIENRESISHGAGRATDPGRAAARNGKIENFSVDSIYQLDATFTADSGRAFTLGQLRGRPVVLTMFFASCGYACPLLLTDMQAIREKLPAGVRDQAAFVLVSFDTVRDTPAALATYRGQRQLDAQWTLLHGDDSSVRELAALLGVKYKQEADGMFAHSNLITILNPAGEIVHQRNGLKGGLDETAQVLAAVAR